MIVAWLGLEAAYTPEEREIMAQLAIAEQTILHVLKSLCTGEIQNHKNGITEGRATDKSGEETVAFTPAPSVYTDPEDIPFGSSSAFPRWRSGDRSTSDTNSGESRPKGKKQRPIYAVCWSFKKHRQTKTKARALRSIRAWKIWKDRQGWKVVPLGVNAIAISPTGEREAIVLHEYDKKTLERL